MTKYIYMRYAQLIETKEVISDPDSGSQVTLFAKPNGYTGLTALSTPAGRRNSGGATRVMQKAIARARQIGNPIELILLPDDDTDWDELHNFYTKLGFVSDTKSPAIMRMEITNLK